MIELLIGILVGIVLIFVHKPVLSAKEKLIFKYKKFVHATKFNKYKKLNKTKADEMIKRNTNSDGQIYLDRKDFNNFGAVKIAEMYYPTECCYYFDKEQIECLKIEYIKIQFSTILPRTRAY